MLSDQSVNNSSRTGLVLIFITICLQVVTNVLFKKAALSIESFTPIEIILNILYIASLVVYFLRSIVWQLVLKHCDLNFAFSIRSLSFAILLFIGHKVFGESIDVYNIIGVFVIILGVIITGISHND